MNYLLFVSFDTGLLYNSCHTTFEAIRESVEQLIIEEGLELGNEKLPSLSELKRFINENDDYVGYLSNGTWFHIQPQSVFEIIR